MRGWCSSNDTVLVNLVTLVFISICNAIIILYWVKLERKRKLERRFHSGNASNVFVYITTEELKNAKILGHFGFVFEELGQGNHMVIATPSFSETCVFKMFSVHTNNKKAVFQTALLSLKRVFEKLRFRDGLVWTVVLTVQIKVHLQISPEKAAECTSYSSLTSGDRKITYIRKSKQCDDNLNGWYRFQGAAGTRMPTSCPPTYRCDTSAPGWLNSGHPTVADGKVTRQVCFHWGSKCCYWFTNIQVRNCGSFYVYHFGGTPDCHLRYCGSD